MLFVCCVAVYVRCVLFVVCCYCLSFVACCLLLDVVVALIGIRCSLCAVCRVLRGCCLFAGSVC